MARRVRRSGDRGKGDDKPKTFADQAAEIGDWLEDVRDSGPLVRTIKLWWHRHTILEYALAGADEALNANKSVEKIRKAIGIAVSALGGPAIDWAKQAVKKED